MRLLFPDLSSQIQWIMTLEVTSNLQENEKYLEKIILRKLEKYSEYSF